jgi:ankyrin repeat protein
MQPLDDYVCLRLLRVEKSLTSSEGHVPFVLSRLIGRHYHVGPEGANIGTSSDCTVRIPPESEAFPKHAQISWITGTKSTDGLSCHYELCDLTKGQGLFRVLPSTPTVPVHESACTNLTTTTGQGSDNISGVRLSRGVQFQTGRLVWSLTALPGDQVLTIKMFSAAREGRLQDLCHFLDNAQCSDGPIPLVFVTPPPAASEHRISQYKFSTLSIVTEKGIDVNSEYHPPNSDDSSSYHPLSSVLSPSAVSTGPLPHPSPYLLLHIAVVNKDLDMVLYLLDKGAEVNLQSGPLLVTSLHLASQLGQPDIFYHLLARGGDVELRDVNRLTALDLTSSYEIRKMLLNSVLLCAASEAGDVEEVSRLLNQCGVPVNVCGLRHKAPLHLASASGHATVVDLLLASGANVNSRGGGHKRTPLHYASLYNHVGIATTLLAAGASEVARDSGGLTPLNLSMGGDMCKLLHKQPLSLCLAVQSEDVQRVQQLLEENEEENHNLVDQRNEHSHAPLHIACTTGNMELVELLISHGADVNLRGGCDGWTPIFYAAMAGHSSLVEFLLAVGASTEVHT